MYQSHDSVYSLEQEYFKVFKRNEKTNKMRISKFNPPYYMYMELVSSVLQVRKSHKVTGLHTATKSPRKAKEKTIPHFEPYLHCDFHC